MKRTRVKPYIELPLTSKRGSFFLIDETMLEIRLKKGQKIVRADGTTMSNETIYEGDHLVAKTPVLLVKTYRDKQWFLVQGYLVYRTKKVDA